jgi:hypothetical protein
LNLANAKYLQKGQRLLFYPVSQSWSEGTGYFYQDVQNPEDGASWNFRIQSGSSWAVTGSSYISSVSSSYTFSSSVSIEDVRVDVTPIVQGWLSASYPNNGILVKLPDADEANQILKSQVYFFSEQTHTIYRPTLETGWNSQTFVTGTLSPIPQENRFVTVRNLNEAYKVGVRTKIRVHCREAYPQKVTENVFRYNKYNYLPSGSYYSIVDANTNKNIIPFDSYSLIDCDITGSYFTLDTSPLYPNRYYKVLIKIDDNSNTEIFEVPQQFKIVQ